VRLERRSGNYVIADRPLALIWPGNRVTDRLTDQVHSLFILGYQRTSGQDLEFGVNQLVEIAVRALSPGTNDPFTATTCVDRLGSALCRLAARDMPSPYRHDRQNQLRVIAPADTFPEIIDAAFNQIRQYGRSSAAVTIRLLETIAMTAGFTHRPEERMRSCPKTRTAGPLKSAAKRWGSYAAKRLGLVARTTYARAVHATSARQRHPESLPVVRRALRSDAPAATTKRSIVRRFLSTRRFALRVRSPRANAASHTPRDSRCRMRRAAPRVATGSRKSPCVKTTATLTPRNRRKSIPSIMSTPRRRAAHAFGRRVPRTSGPQWLYSWARTPTTNKKGNAS